MFFNEDGSLNMIFVFMIVMCCLSSLGVGAYLMWPKDDKDKDE
jgi:hypothetical protein